jgi:hypothetical protein
MTARSKVLFLCAIGLWPLASCSGPDVRLDPVSEGSHTLPPAPRGRVAVFSDDPRTAAGGSRWLAEHGLTVIDPQDVERAFQEELAAGATRGDKAFQDASRRLRADIAVILTTTIRETNIRPNTNVLMGRTPGGAGAVAIMPQYQDSGMFPGATGAPTMAPGMARPIHAFHVDVRAVDVASGQVGWSGNAKFPRPIFADEMSDVQALETLTRHALSKAWGLPPPEGSALPVAPPQ